MNRYLKAGIPNWLESVTIAANAGSSLGIIRVRGLEIDFWASEASLYSWLLEYLNPLPLDPPCEPQLQFRLGCYVDDYLVHKTMRYIDSGTVKLAKVETGNGSVERMEFSSRFIVDCHRREGVIWITDLNRQALTVVCSSRTKWVALEVSRCVRELITGYLEHQGWQAFHSGAVRTTRGTFLIIGNSGAGKTSLILSLISTGAQFIANERSYVNVIDGEVHVLSFPLPIAIGLGSALQYPEIAKFVRHPEYCLYPPRRMDIRKVQKTSEHRWPLLPDKVQLLPNEMTLALNAPSSLAGDRVSGVVVPNLTAEQPLGAKPLAFHEARKIVKKNYFSRDKQDVYPAWMPLPFGLPDREQRNQIIDAICELQAIRLDYYASSERQNEIYLYPEIIEEALAL